MIICNRESSVKSHLITALHSYKRTNPVIDAKGLQRYLQKHFINPNHISIGASRNVLAYPAYSVDPRK